MPNWNTVFVKVRQNKRTSYIHSVWSAWELSLSMLVTFCLDVLHNKYKTIFCEESVISPLLGVAGTHPRDRQRAMPKAKKYRWTIKRLPYLTFCCKGETCNGFSFPSVPFNIGFGTFNCSINRSMTFCLELLNRNRSMENKHSHLFKLRTEH